MRGGYATLFQITLTTCLPYYVKFEDQGQVKGESWRSQEENISK